MIQLDRALYIKDSSSDFSTLRVSDEVELEAGTFPARFPRSPALTRGPRSLGAAFEMCLELPAPVRLRATLAWMDAAADVGAGHALVNDLDLAVYRSAVRVLVGARSFFFFFFFFFFWLEGWSGFENENGNGNGMDECVMKE